MRNTKPIIVEGLTIEHFRQFGTVLADGTSIDQLHQEVRSAHTPSAARNHIWQIQVDTPATMPLLAKRMERHPYSTQTFVPVGVPKWLVLVARMNEQGRPDMMAARAIEPAPGEGIILHANIWHHPLIVLSAAAEFVVSQWKTGDDRDEEFVDVVPTFVVNEGRHHSGPACFRQ